MGVLLILVAVVLGFCTAGVLETLVPSLTYNTCDLVLLTGAAWFLLLWVWWRSWERSW